MKFAGNVLFVGVTAFASVWLINKGLNAAGLGKFTTYGG